MKQHDGARQSPGKSESDLSRSGGSTPDGPARATAAPTDKNISLRDGEHRSKDSFELNASYRPSSESTQLSPIAPFVSKTYGIVSDESDEVVSWWKTDGEDTFVIKHVDVFQERVLPRFFSHNNYSSFVRQLNNHGFTRVRSPSSASRHTGGSRGGRPEHETNWWEFKHPKFRRGNKALLAEIQRRKEKKRSVLSPPISELLAAQTVPARSANHAEGPDGDAPYVSRGELGNVRVELQELNRKLDELKSLVVGLLMFVHDTGLPMPVPPSPGHGEVHGGTGMAFARGLSAEHGSQVHQQHQQQYQQEEQTNEQRQPPHQSRQPQYHRQQSQPHQQQDQQQDTRRRQQQVSQTARHTDGSHSNNDSFLYGGSVSSNMQQGPSNTSKQGNHGAGRKHAVQEDDHHPHPMTPNDGGTKRARDDASPPPRTRQPHASVLPPSASTPSAGPMADTQVDTADGHDVGGSALFSPSVTSAGGSGGASALYRDRWTHPLPPGGGGGVPHGASVAWQGRWPDVPPDTFYPFRVPMRMAGYPFPMPGVPIPYAMPGQGSKFLHSEGMGMNMSGGTPAGAAAASTPSAVMRPHEALAHQAGGGPTAHGVDSSVALMLSALKGRAKSRSGLMAGQLQQQSPEQQHHRPQHQQHRGMGNRDRLDSDSASSTGSRRLTGNFT